MNVFSSSYLADPQIILDESGKILYANEAFQRWTLLKAPQYLYKPFESIAEGSLNIHSPTELPLAFSLHRKTVFFKNNKESTLIGECITREESLLPEGPKHICLTIKINETTDTSDDQTAEDQEWQTATSFLEQLPNGVALIDQENLKHLLFSNSQLAYLHNFNSDEDFFNALLAQHSFKEVVQQLLSSQKNCKWEGFVNTSRQFPEGYYLIQLKLYRYGQKEVIACFIDKSEQLSARTFQVSELQKQVDSLEKHAHAGLWTYDLATQEIWWSAGVYQLLGLDPSQYAPSIKLFLERIHPEDVERISTTLEGNFMGKQKVEIPFRILKDNLAYQCKFTLQPRATYHLKKRRSFISGVIGRDQQQQDNTQHTKWLKQLQTDMAQMSNIGIWEWDIPTDHFTWSLHCNDFFEDAQGKSSITETFTQHIHPFEHKKVLESIEKAKQGKVQEISFHFIKGKEDRAFSMRLIPVSFISQKCTQLIGMMMETTDSKSLEDELRHYQYLSQNVTDAIISTTIDLKIRTWNLAAEKIYGWTAEEAIGLSLKDILFKNNISPRVFQDFSRKLSTVGEWKGRMEQIDKFGNPLVVYSSTHMIKDPDNNLLGLVMVNRNLTNLLETSQRLDKYSRQLEVMFENTPGFIFLVDLNLHIMGHNTNFLKLLGTEDELIGRSLLDLPVGNKSTLEVYFKRIQSVIAGKKAQYKINDVVSYQNKQIWVDSDYVPIRNKHGEMTGVLCVIDDITERMEFQSTIRENQRNLSAIIENADYALCYMDTGYKLKAFNSSFERLYSTYFNSEVSLGDDCLKLLTSTWQEHLSEIFEYVMLGKQLTTEREMIMRDEYIWIEFTCNPVIDGDSITGLCLSIRDINTRKKNEQLLLRSKVNETKIRSLATIQGQEDERNRISMELHDGVGQILTALQMQSNYIQTKTFQSQHDLNQKLTKLDQLVTEAKQEVRRISFNLMPRMLKDFGLAESIKGLSQLVFNEASGIFYQLEITLDRERYSFEIEVGIFRVMQEITNNILKYSEADHVTISLFSSKAGIHLSVADNGIGFDYDAVMMATQEKNGLQNIKHRIQILGGTLSLKTKPGAGCAYSIIIPSSHEEGAEFLTD